jgi:8-oxo-dGTP pyrophosphatase MutT (NUDIX family)
VNNLSIDDVRSRLATHVPVPADPTGRMQAAVAVVLAPDASGALSLLLIRRADVHGDPWSGQMGLPGGRRDADDPDLLATARRETEEETGVRLPVTGLLGALDDIAPITPVLPPVAVRPFVFALDRIPPITPSHEVADYLWVAIDTLSQTAGTIEIEIRDERRTMPAFHIGPHVVWGMTHRIVNNFISLVTQ